MTLFRWLCVSLVALAVAPAGCGFGDDLRALEGDDDPDAGAGAADARDELGPDAAPDPVACTLVDQTGCPAGDACDLASSAGDTACRDVASAGSDDDTCDDAVDCAAGFTCVDVGAGSSCMAFCGDDGDCDGAGGYCVVTLGDGAGNDVPGVTLCSQRCAPTSGSGCPAGWNCRLFDDAGRDYTQCAPAGSGDQGDGCTATSDCAVGFTCVEHGDGVSCQRWCVVGQASNCAAFPGTACREFTTPPTIDGVEYGVCL